MLARTESGFNGREQQTEQRQDNFRASAGSDKKQRKKKNGEGMRAIPSPSILEQSSFGCWY